MDDRLFTAFVSSTYRDLQQERQRAARVLLENSCLPLGMEYFPSDGRDVWSLIEASMARADFFVLILGGAYGSIDPETGESWTQREWRRMIALRKPIVALLGPSDTSVSVDPRLDAFRCEIEARGDVCQYWSTEADLVERLAQSVGALTRQSDKVAGWTRVAPATHRLRPSRWENRLYSSDWHLTPSAIDGLWDVTVLHRREIRSLDPNGVAGIKFSTSRPETGGILPLTAGGGPIRELLAWSRSTDMGRVVLGEAVYRTPYKFRQDVQFEPAVLPEETLEFNLSTTLREAHFASVVDMANALGKPPEREWDWVTVKITDPTEMLEMSVSFGCGAVIRLRGVEAIGEHDEPDTAESQRALRAFKIKKSNGSCQIARLQLPAPCLATKYRISWFLPEGRTGGTTTPRPPLPPRGGGTA